MKMRKIVAIAAAVLMLLSVMPIAAFAADSETIKYTISNYPAGTQYKAETHELDDYLTVITNTRCHFTSELRIYAPSGSVNGEVILASTREMTTVVLNAGNKASTLTVSTSPDNSTWTQHSTLSVVSSYKDLSISNLPAGTKYVKLVNGSGQVRVKYITVTYAASSEPETPDCEHVWVDADCTTPKTCSACGATEGEALGHSYGEGEQTLAPTCTDAGEMEYTCSACGDVKTETVNALGHNWVDGVCDVCDEVEPAITEVTIDFSTTAQRVSFSTTQQVWQNGALKLTNNKAGSSSNVADYSDPARFYKSSTITIECAGMTSLVIAASGSNSDWAATLDSANLTYTKTNDGYTITFAAPTDSITLTCAAQVRANSITAIVEKQAESDCEHDYVGVETQAPTCTVPGATTYTCSKCEESYTEEIAVIPHSYVEDIIDSTCTTTGTKTYECSVCFDSYDETIPVKPHNYVDDVCADCSAVKAYKGTITFDANKTQRTEYTTQIQIWANEGLTFTNNKLTGNNIGDYGAPVRIYKNSQIVIEFPEMAKLIIDASGIGSDYAWDATLADLTYTVENGVYTITFDEPVNSIELTAANQVRANSITAIAAHECVYDNAFDTDCNKCGDIRKVDSPVSFVGKSISEDVNGLAFLFNVEAEGIAVKAGTFVQADFTNATYNGYKLLGVGVIASNGNSETNIEGLRMYDLENGNAKFAFRVINIPADKLDVEITMTPYYIVEIEGVATTIYGEAQVGSYAAVAG